MIIQKILESGKTIFTVQDMVLLTGNHSPQSVRNAFQRLKKNGALYKLQNGIRGLKNYDHRELAMKLKKGSYISCETVLKQAGVLFQYYGNTITCISDNTLTKSIDGISYSYRKIHDTIRINPLGIQVNKGYMIATPERALCDMLYVSSAWQPDDLSTINPTILQKISTIYRVPRVALPIKQWINDRSTYT